MMASQDARRWGGTSLASAGRAVSPWWWPAMPDWRRRSEQVFISAQGAGLVGRGPRGYVVVAKV